jgi:DNA-binding MarR family transcriptional regulator
MQATLLSHDERTVIDALADEGEGTLPADLDPAVHSLEQRGWISLVSRGAVIDGEREYTLDLTPYGRMVARRSRPRRSARRADW